MAASAQRIDATLEALADPTRRGVVDLLRMKAWVWEEGDPPPNPTLEELPPEAAEDADLVEG